MIRGLLAGSLTLIVLYTVSQSGVAERLGTAGAVIDAGLRRFLSPDVAGVGDRSARSAGRMLGGPSTGINSGISPAAGTPQGRFFQA